MVRKNERSSSSLSFILLSCLGGPFSVIGSERADYNCKCYHKPRLMPAGEEMNWHVGVKLRVESAGGRMMSTGSASVVNGPEE